MICLTTYLYFLIKVTISCVTKFILDTKVSVSHPSVRVMARAGVHIILSRALIKFIDYNACNPQNLQTLTDHTNKPGTVNKQFIIFPFTDRKRKVVR